MSHPLVRLLVDLLRRPLRRAAALGRAPGYGARVGEELSRFREEIEIHALPPIFHYWSDRYVRPKLETFGFSNPDGFFQMHIEACCARAGSEGDYRSKRIISLGAGNCDTEVRLARALLMLADFGKRSRPKKVIPKVSFEALAQMIGTTIARVSFFMKKFRKLGFIDYNGELKINNSLLNVILLDNTSSRAYRHG